MDIFHMSDIIPLIGLPYPPYGRSNYNVPCPCCDDEPHAKHLNINLQKDVFRCPRCGFSGGIFDLYAYYTGIAREEVRDALIARLDVQGSIPNHSGGRDANHCKAASIQRILSVRCTRLLPKRREMVLCL